MGPVSQRLAIHPAGSCRIRPTVPFEDQGDRQHPTRRMPIPRPPCLAAQVRCREVLPGNCNRDHPPPLVHFIRERITDGQYGQTTLRVSGSGRWYHTKAAGRRPAAHLPFRYRLDHTVPQVLRIRLRHAMLASVPSKHVESDFRPKGNPIFDSTYSQKALAEISVQPNGMHGKFVLPPNTYRKAVTDKPQSCRGHRNRQGRSHGGFRPKGRFPQLAAPHQFHSPRSSPGPAYDVPGSNRASR